MFVETNVDFVRGVASWKPITDKGQKHLPAFGMVAFVVSDDKVTVCVTDRYRIVYAVFDGDYSESAGETFVVPMGLFTRFAAACKNENGGLPVRIEIMGDVLIEGAGLSMRDELYGGSYPRVNDLVEKWQPNTGVAGELFVDMVLLGEVMKIGNPFERHTTPAKRNNSWRMLRGVSATVGREGSLRLDRGVPEKFGVLLQPKQSLA